jgi:hypothetical protein
VGAMLKVLRMVVSREVPWNRRADGTAQFHEHLRVLSLAVPEYPDLRANLLVTREEAASVPDGALVFLTLELAQGQEAAPALRAVPSPAAASSPVATSPAAAQPAEAAPPSAEE